MDINIRYNRGMMTVHMEEFMHCRSTPRLKKLIRLIRASSSPECEDVIREYVWQKLEQSAQRQKETGEYIVRCREELRNCEEQLNEHVAQRKRYGKAMPSGQKFFISSQIGRLRITRDEKRTMLRNYQSALREEIREEKFLRKALEIMTEAV